MQFSVLEHAVNYGLEYWLDQDSGEYVECFVYRCVCGWFLTSEPGDRGARWNAERHLQARGRILEV